MFTAYLALGCRWQRRWGATDEEVSRDMPGDDIVADPTYLTTRAITVDAPPDCIYQWLLQMGYRRGGLYSYDFLDRLFGFLDAQSAGRILPEFQDLKAGDVIPIGKGTGFPVRELVPNSVFVLGDPEARWSWQTVLYEVAAGQTRLVTRNRGRFGDGLGQRFFMFWLDLAAFIMVRRWLLVLKQRAEKLADERRSEQAGVQASEAPVTLLG